MRYAVLNSDNTVENVIVAYPEAIAGLSAALGKALVQAGEIPLSVGDLYDPLLNQFSRDGATLLTPIEELRRQQTVTEEALLELIEYTMGGGNG